MGRKILSVNGLFPTPPLESLFFFAAITILRLGTAAIIVTTLSAAGTTSTATTVNQIPWSG